ncbi:MAG: hypothetical protein V1861_04860 [Candidatus Micrarchaeota archaeon]
MASKGTTKGKTEAEKRERRHLRLVVSNPALSSDAPKSQGSPASAPRTERLQASDVAEGLKILARNWDGEVEELLALPKELFYYPGHPSQVYSNHENPGLGVFAQSLSFGVVALPKTDYGIVLHATSDNEYIVLFDARRRIIVRERLESQHGAGDWADVKTSIKAALALADSDEAKKEGLFAYFDGRARLVKPQASV